MQANMYWHNYNRLKTEKPHLPTSALRRITNKYFAPPDAKAPPGHTTGGAVDVGLVGPDFHQLDMIAPTQGWDAAYTWSSLLGEESLRNLMMLIEALLSVGFSNCRDEWWHWSYGDNAWSVRTGCAVAMYGLIAPPLGYTFVARPMTAGPRRIGIRAHGPRIVARED
jgi:zinc D-Ala-D-Ala dipeptidase